MHETFKKNMEHTELCTALICQYLSCVESYLLGPFSCNPACIPQGTAQETAMEHAGALLALESCFYMRNCLLSSSLLPWRINSMWMDGFCTVGCPFLKRCSYSYYLEMVE